MTFVDLHVDPLLRTEDDLANLAYFGCVGAVMAPVVRHQNDTAAELIETLQGALRACAPAGAADGVAAAATAVAVAPEARPSRAHPELWHALESWLADGTIDLLGPIDASDPALAEIQLDIAARASVPAVVALQPRSSTRVVQQVVETALRCGQPLDRVALQGCDYTNLRAVVAAGAWAVVDVSPRGMGRDAADMLGRFGERAVRRAMLTGGGQPAFDVLALPRTLEALRDRGLPDRVLGRVAHLNASRFLARG